jgi:hypothetical protein
MTAHLVHVQMTAFYGLTSANKASPLAPLIPFRTPARQRWQCFELTELGHLLSRVDIRRSHVGDHHTCLSAYHFFAETYNSWLGPNGGRVRHWVLR